MHDVTLGSDAPWIGLDAGVDTATASTEANSSTTIYSTSSRVHRARTEIMVVGLPDRGDEGDEAEGKLSINEAGTVFNFGETETPLLAFNTGKQLARATPVHTSPWNDGDEVRRRRCEREGGEGAQAPNAWRLVHSG